MPRFLPALLVALACGGHHEASAPTAPRPSRLPAPPARAEDPAAADAVAAAVRAHEVLTARSVVPSRSDVLCNAAMNAAAAVVGQPAEAVAWSGDGERDRPLLENRLTSLLARAKKPLPADLSLELARAMAMAAQNPHVWAVDAPIMANVLALISGQKGSGLGFDAHAAGGHWVVSDVHAGGPAAAAGVKRGDVVVSLDRRPFDEQSLFRVTLFLTAGQHVDLEIESGGKRKLMDLEAKVVARPIVTSRVLGKGVGYIHIHYLPRSKDPAGDAGVLLAGALKELDAKKVDKLVIDLRDDGGGNPFDVASILIHADGPLLMGQDPGGKPEPIPRSAEAWKKRHKLAVLVNAQSYSAAEMVALAIQAYGEGRLFGEPTGGALTFPGQENLPGGVTLFFPAGLTLDPRGKLPERQRVTPDEAVPSTTAADIAAGRDAQLDAAVAWLKKR
jgi:C-terminal processing protease CtpA/Prc